MYKGLLLLFLSVHCYSSAQERNSKDPIINQQIWIDFYPHFYISDKFEYYGDVGYRTIIDEFSWTRLYARPSIKFHFSKGWEIHSGVGILYIYNDNDINRFEIAPWQGIQVNWPRANRISFKHLVKLEERISFNTNNWNSSFSLRLRYKISGKLWLFKAKEMQKWYIPFYAEIFYPINDEIEEFFKNKSRVGIGVGYNSSKVWSISALVNWQSSRIGFEDELNVSDIAYQIKIMKQWKSNK